MIRNIFLLFVICLILVTQVSDSAVPQNTDTAILTDSAKTEQDSLFVQINQSFRKIKPILEYSCYDCHSADTKKPWYFNIPGINSLIKSHIKAGRKHLDFTNGFPFKSDKTQLAILHDIKEEIKNRDMPLFSYRIMHWGRLIEFEQKDSLFFWLENTETVLETFYELYNIPYIEQDLED